MSSAAHSHALQAKLRSQLADRRARLQSNIKVLNQPEDLVRLLAEVDSALSRLDAGDFGTCVVCHEAIAPEDLLANPMMSYCLCELSPERQRALERDLDLAWRVQSALLPSPDLALPGWQAHYRYLPHGPVSGDYCDLIVPDGDGASQFYFMVGDVSGKGVAASLLMAHLNALLRTLARTGLSPADVMARANRVLSESTLASHYATLVCGRASASGEVEIANAGHCPPVVVRAGGSFEVLRQSGLPLGLAVASEPAWKDSSEKIVLDENDLLVIYTDGLTEGANPEGDEYGSQRLHAQLRNGCRQSARVVIEKCLGDFSSFLDGAQRSDDLTILALGRQGAVS
jgi:sigma-B regulation protein RsbU (phosphoserine phosphatase)